MEKKKLSSFMSCVKCFSLRVLLSLTWLDVSSHPYGNHRISPQAKKAESGKIGEITRQERTEVVFLHPSPRRTANSRKSGLSQRLILLNRQEEGKRSDFRIANSVSLESVSLPVGKASQKNNRADRKPTKKAKGASAKPKREEATQSGLKRKRKNQEHRGPYKKTKSEHPATGTWTDERRETDTSSVNIKENTTNEKTVCQGLPAHSEKRGGKAVTLRSCLVKVVPLGEMPGIFSQPCTATHVQSSSIPKSLSNARHSVEEDGSSGNIWNESTDKQTANSSVVRNLFFDLDTELERVNVLDEETETETVTSILDNNVVEEVVEEVAILFGERDNSETATINALDKEHSQNDAFQMCQNTPQSSDNEMPPEKQDTIGTSLSASSGTSILDRDSLNLLTPLRQVTRVNGWEANLVQRENSAVISDVPEYNADRIEVNNSDTCSVSSGILPIRSGDSEWLSTGSESSTAALSIVVKLEPLNRTYSGSSARGTATNRRRPNRTQKPTTRSDTGHKPPRLSVEDIVWGKVHGHPWWPGRIFALSGTIDEVGSTSVKNARVTWFGSSTNSIIPITRLLPFAANFSRRHLPNKRGCYRMAVKEAQDAIKTHTQY